MSPCLRNTGFELGFESSDLARLNPEQSSCERDSPKAVVGKPFPSAYRTVKRCYSIHPGVRRGGPGSRQLTRNQTAKEFEMNHKREITRFLLGLSLLVGFIVLPPNTGYAMEQRQQVSQTLDADELKTIRLFKEASPAVVYITTSNRILTQRRSMIDLQEVPRGTGSGFVWDREGHIVTNYHVIRGSDSAQVTLADESEWSAKLVNAAPEFDLAVLKIDAPRDQLSPLPIGMSSQLQVGQNVYAIGNPFGLDHTLTSGIISGLDRQIRSQTGETIPSVIQTDAAINPGNSGGPLLNSSGQLIGVNTAIYSPSGAYAGVGFAVPADTVFQTVPDLIAESSRPAKRLGVRVANAEVSRLIGAPGLVVIDIVKGSAAEQAGLRSAKEGDDGSVVSGDIIMSVNGNRISSTKELGIFLSRHEGDEPVMLGVIRDGRPVRIPVDLG